MRDSYWSFMEQVNFAFRYNQAYFMRIRFFQRCVRAFSAVIACSSVAAWSGWNRLPGLWATLIFLSEIINIIMPLLPFSDRANALKYLIPDMRDLANRVDIAWGDLNGSADDAFREPLCAFRQEYEAIHTKYLGADDIPNRKRLALKIARQNADYLKRFFYPNGGETTNV